MHAGTKYLYIVSEACNVLNYVRDTMNFSYHGAKCPK